MKILGGIRHLAWLIMVLPFIHAAIISDAFVKVSTPASGIIRIVKAESSNNFWISEINGDLFYFNGQDMTTIPAPPVSDVNDIAYCISDSLLTALVINDQFNTQIFRYSSKTWIPYKYVLSVPVRNILPLSETEHLAYGDWGTIAFISESYVREIKTPVKAHILSVFMVEPSDLWFGTEGDGIYHYKNGQFIQVMNDQLQHQSIMDIRMSGDQLTAVTRSGEIFYISEYSAESAENIETNLQIYFHKARIFPGTGILAIDLNGILYQLDSITWKPVKFPYNNALHGLMKADDGSIILGGSHGSVFLQAEKNDVYFIDQAGSRYISGNEFEKSTGVALIDLDNDNDLDIYVFNSGTAGQQSRLYLNSDGEFADVSYIAGLPQLGTWDQFIFYDLNQDGNIDLAALYLSPDGYTFGSWIQGKKYSFRAGEQLKGENGRYSKPTFLLPTLISDAKELNLIGGFYYSEGNSSGTLLPVDNSLSGNLRFLKNQTDVYKRGWFVAGFSADLNNDNFPDYYYTTKWGVNHLWLSMEKDSLIPAFVDTVSNNTHGTVPIDLDNDGDLDLVEIHEGGHLSVYENDGAGHYSDITETVFPAHEYSHFMNINSGDFNLDGFVDLFGSHVPGDPRSNVIILNKGGKILEEMDGDIGLDGPGVTATAVGDLDNDGDLDIYGTRRGLNSAWYNTLNKNSFLKITLRGIKSPATGFGSKVWIYRSGNSDSLVGFNQSISTNFNSYQQNSPTFHFGLPDGASFDIVAEFPSGVVRHRSGIPPGSHIVLYEYTGLAAFFISLPASILNVALDREVQAYTLSIILCFALVFGTVRVGTRTYGWTNQAVVWFILLILTIFWIITFLTLERIPLVKYGLPVLSITLGSLTALGVTLRIDTVKRRYFRKESAMKDLLTELKIFTHGEWVMMNLNSLQLLTENGLGKNSITDEFIKMYTDRSTTFLTLSYPAFEKLTGKFSHAGIQSAGVERLSTAVQLLRSNLEEVKRTGFDKEFRQDNYQLITSTLSDIKTLLSSIKTDIFSQFTCDINSTVKTVVNELDSKMKDSPIVIQTQFEEGRPAPGLIPAEDLAFVLDNLIMNGVRATAETENPSIQLTVYHRDPFIRIDVKDNGKGIPKQDWETVFSEGYSTSGSTGLGLFQGRAVLESYGGKIFIHSSSPNWGTIITIELTEGRFKDET